MKPVYELEHFVIRSPPHKFWLFGVSWHLPGTQ